ncbi:MAG TPA: rod shape-determining protein MreC [Candidatus Magasanikbacteria bacterium]|nr:rod shape-determining protein MreC [Candidatus Magasanikbacteria bacterium]
MKRKSILASLLILIFIIFFHYQGWLSPIEAGARFIVGKSSFAIYNLSNDIKNYFARWASYKNLFEENKKCLEKLTSFSVQQAELSQLREENNILRSQLNFIKNDSKVVLANIIGKSPDSSSNVLLIDRGSEDEIREGQAVITGDGILVGKIIKTESNIAQVKILTDNQSRISASIYNQDKTIGVVNGEHNLRLKLTLVPLTEVIKQGDIVVSSNLDKNIPSGLLIGKIESVEKELYQPFQTAIIKPAVDLNKLSIISVLIN